MADSRYSFSVLDNIKYMQAKGNGVSCASSADYPSICHCRPWRESGSLFLKIAFEAVKAGEVLPLNTFQLAEYQSWSSADSRYRATGPIVLVHH